MFSLMKQIKLDRRLSLSENFLSTLIQICMEVPEPEFLSPISAITFGMMQSSLKDQMQLGIARTKKQNKKTRTFLDLEESNDKSNLAGENILSSSE